MKMRTFFLHNNISQTDIWRAKLEHVFKGRYYCVHKIYFLEGIFFLSNGGDECNAGKGDQDFDI